MSWSSAVQTDSSLLLFRHALVAGDLQNLGTLQSRGASSSSQTNGINVVIHGHMLLLMVGG